MDSKFICQDDDPDTYPSNWEPLEDETTDESNNDYDLPEDDGREIEFSDPDEFDYDETDYSDRDDAFGDTTDSSSDSNIDTDEDDDLH